MKLKIFIVLLLALILIVEFSRLSLSINKENLTTIANALGTLFAFAIRELVRVKKKKFKKKKKD